MIWCTTEDVDEFLAFLVVIVEWAEIIGVERDIANGLRGCGAGYAGAGRGRC